MLPEERLCGSGSQDCTKEERHYCVCCCCWYIGVRRKYSIYTSPDHREQVEGLSEDKENLNGKPFTKIQKVCTYIQKEDWMETFFSRLDAF